MKILKLVAENVKKLTVVEITPDGNLVEISGKNGQGKTSLLDAIQMALDGASIPGEPIRRGQDKASVTLDLGTEKLELVVKRSFTKTGSYLTITNADGFAAKAPQRLLDTMLGAISLDPLAFMRSKRKEQFDTLRGLVKLEIDPAEVLQLNERDFAARAELNKDALRLRASAELMKVPEGLPVSLIDEMAIVDEIQAVGQFNASLTTEAERRANAVANAHNSLVEAKKLRDRAAKLIADAESLEANASTANAALFTLEPIAEPKSAEDLKAKLAAAKATNANIQLARKRTAIFNDAKQIEAKAEVLTGTMTLRRAQLDEALAAAELPVPGLGFGDGVVTLNAIPLDQASDAEQLLASVAIAAAFNPKLRVIRIRDGSLLDRAHVEGLAKFAQERDLQIWMECVESSRTSAIILEDGHIKAKAEAAE